MTDAEVELLLATVHINIDGVEVVDASVIVGGATLWCSLDDLRHGILPYPHDDKVDMFVQIADEIAGAKRYV